MATWFGVPSISLTPFLMKEIICETHYLCPYLENHQVFDSHFWGIHLDI